MDTAWLRPRPSDFPRLVALGAAAALLLAAIVAGYFVLRLPATRSQKNTLLAYEQSGRFNYMVHLKPNTIYDSTELGPGGVYFTSLAQSIGLSFDYRLNSPQLPAQRPLEYEVTASLGEPGLWQKQYVLVPLSRADGAVSTTFALPLAQYQGTLETIRKEAGSAGTAGRVVVEARVQPAVNTDFGAISTPFTQTLTVELGRDTFKVTGDLASSKPAAITKTVTLPVPEVDLYRKLVAGAVLLSLALLSVLALAYYRAHLVPPTPDDQAALAASLYRSHLVWVSNLPDREAQAVIHVRSLDDLARAAEELMKPVLVLQLPRGYLFTVIDSADRLRYEYLALPAAEPVPEQTVSAAGRAI